MALPPLPNAEEPIADAAGKSTPRWRAWLQRVDGLVQSLGSEVASAAGSYIAKALLTTRGDIIARDAVGPVRLQLGAAGTFLRAGATDPAWAALPGAWTAVQGPTSVGTGTTYAVTGLAGYTMLLVAFEGVSHNNASSRRLRIRLGVSGPAFRSSGYVTRSSVISGAGEGTVTGTSGIEMTSDPMPSAQASSGLLMLAGFGPSANKTVVTGLGLDDDGLNMIYGRYDTAEAHDAIQFLWDGAGNFDGGSVTIWGTN